MTDKIRSQNSFESLKKKYLGTGNPDIPKWEWETNVQRDVVASNISHFSRLNYISTALNEHPAKTRLRLMTKMVLPKGTIPEDLKD